VLARMRCLQCSRPPCTRGLRLRLSPHRPFAGPLTFSPSC
jgi:hypothetical protein